ncbi:hypothetical protein MJO28_009206 [Puccinia striiformis f. sp. tritici]|uniref:Uncharacterized protein n=1 Tax=Puccinia striiformis f. sp. tritici TaxID=168172 RepID=A0ACC0E748_9BASI|nr:hypothetical protein Pst134EB_018757 [Puccinia striiformis f. sp. tritici]KAI7947298.1 hypothetical protein MJO28_009206 [Puccinia striiformis f. sp. tritici]KAI7950381.1 hypothetical protein MJO29_009055 [Puccinia striiformis f. sp. tritici]
MGTSSFLRQLKYDLLAALVEFMGTLLFLLLGLGGIQASATASIAHQTSQDAAIKVASMQQLLYIATSMGLALLATAWTFFRVSGSVFNPNIALALLLTGALSPMRFVLYVVAEILGAIAASGLINSLPGKLAVNCTLHPQISPAQGVVIEAFLTAALTLTVLFIAVEKHRSTPFAPCAIGLVLFATHLFGVIYTGAAMNSARAFGPDVVTAFSPNHWVYWVGPTVGAVIATLIYYFLKAVDLYALTPKQDSEDLEDSPDYAGIEVVRRRNSLTPTTTSYGRSHHPSHKATQIDPITMMPIHKYGGSQYQPSQAYLPSSERRDFGYNHDPSSPRSSFSPEKHAKNPGHGGPHDDDHARRSYLPSLVAKPSRKRYNPHPPPGFGDGSNSTLNDHKHTGSEDCKEIPIWSPYNLAHQRPENHP